ncbi:hypothetical protein [Deinococcus budaensis]|uniref:Cytotoxic translational repressor of toxin-antitoxin stability system n=1 Tax=Deinococcus budaensis TaxID=1665626 RepID=A0A7W8GH71_9DEIO|nr:hypothetical protein [Deinococcus budaensis]MBB5235585.1 hypothetical protein [Deinococcus budaensis]
MHEVVISAHAAQRYRERFAGNLSWTAVHRRLVRLLARARFLEAQPGGSRIYRLRDMRFVVEGGVLVTVYRLHYRAVPPGEDLWCLAS